VTNRIRTQLYHDAPNFLDNNDDLGAMSSALAWAMLGVYPDYPGSAILSVNGPEFTDARLQLASGKAITIHADGASDASPYIQSLKVNGAASNKTWLDASTVTTGADLEFRMGASPNQAWGGDSTDAMTSAGLELTSAFLFATPNPLTLAPGASATLTLVVQSARADAAQTLSWSASPPQGLSLSARSGSISLSAGARATAKVTVTASAATGNYTVPFTSKSSLGLTPPTFVLPVVVR
jgi:hypothetical protein